MTRNNKILIAVVALAGSVCAFYFLALAPKREEIARLDGDIATKQAQLDQVRQTLAIYEDAKASYESNYAKLARVGKAIPADDDVRSLLVQLEGAADRSGVDFQKIELGSGLAGESSATATDAPAAGGEQLASAPGTVPFAGGTMSAMPFSFTFNGGFFDLSSFLARLERFVTVSNDRIDVNGRLLRLESLKVEPSMAGYPQMQAQIGAATYIVPPTEGVTDEAADGQQAAGDAPATPDDGSGPATTTATATGASR